MRTIGLFLLVVFVVCQFAVAGDKTPAKNGVASSGMYSGVAFENAKDQKRWLRNNLERDISFASINDSQKKGFFYQASTAISGLDKGQLDMATAYYQATRDKANSEMIFKRITDAEKRALQEFQNGQSQNKKDSDSGITVVMDSKFAQQMAEQTSAQDKNIIKISSVLDASPKTKILAEIIDNTIIPWKLRNYAETREAETAAAYPALFPYGSFDRQRPVIVENIENNSIIRQDFGNGQKSGNSSATKAGVVSKNPAPVQVQKPQQQAHPVQSPSPIMMNPQQQYPKGTAR